MTTPTPPSLHADREARHAGLMAAQVLRLPVALSLLALTAQQRFGIAQSIGLYAGPSASYTTTWLRIMLAATAFMLVVAVARRRAAPVPLLVAEIAVAGIVGFVPPYLWQAWLDHRPIAFAIGYEVIAPLAIAWFAIAVAALLRQSRKREAERRAVGTALPDVSPWAGSREVWASVLWPWVRVLALTGVLLLIWPQNQRLNAAGSTTAFVQAWVPLTSLALVFMLFVLVWRRATPLPLLGLELVIAGLLAFTPPPALAVRLGAVVPGAGYTRGFTAALAVAWGTIALLAAVEGRTRDRHPPSS